MVLQHPLLPEQGQAERLDGDRLRDAVSRTKLGELSMPTSC